ncbi:MAG TPA: filamentous hemagglutinin N-terminal domain-containing protein [Caulobacteraceae bacterium]|jgi:filamentous hemagglutinin family protein
MSKRNRYGLRASLFASAALGVFSWATQTSALPTGGTITGTSGGTVTITNPSPTGTVVTTTAHRTLIDWTSFSVASGETVTFNEPDKDAIVVNRQLFGSGSYINGYITSLVGGSVGGNVWIINPNGIVFGPSAHVNVGGLLATTSDLSGNTSAFLDAPDTDPVSFTFSGNGTPEIRIDAGANITVHDGSAVFISGSIYDYGTVTGTGSFATDTKAVFATANNFTVRFGSNPPDPLRATDLDLFDLSATSASGGDLVMKNGASTTAGQVILDNFADLATLAPGTYSNTEVEGAMIDATGNRGDGFDLMIMTGDIANGAPVGGVTSDKTIVTIAPPGGNVSFPTTIESSGGLYVVGDEVLVNNQTGAYATFSVAGHSDLIGHVAVDLTDIGALDTDVAGGSVTIDQKTGALTLGAVSGSDVTIDGFYGVTIGTIAATGNVSLDVSGGLAVGNISAYSLYVGTYGDSTIGNISSTGRIVVIEESGRGNVSIGNVNAAGEFYFTDTLSTVDAGNVTVGSVTAGQNIIIHDSAGSVTTGALSSPSYVYLLSYGTMTIGGATTPVLNARAGYTGNGSGAVYAADIDVTGAITVEDASFIAGGTFRNTAAITAAANGYGFGYTPAGEIVIVANDVDIQASIGVTDVGNGTGRLYVESSNNLGMNVGDNLSNPVGFQMSGAEFAFLQADHVTLEDVSQYGAGIRIGDLTINAAKTPNVEVGEKYGYKYSTISIEGTVQGIGAPSFMVGGPYQEAQKPGTVIVSGALGTAANPMGYVYLGANSKVVLGSQAYLQEWENDTNPGVFQPGLGGVATGHEWISAGNVVLALGYASTGPIIEQNTSATGDGIHITGSLTIEGEPYTVNLFGQLPDGAGGELYGTAAAGSPELFANPGPAQSQWRFNGCQFGGGNCQPLVGSSSYGLPYGGSVTGTSGGNVTLTYTGPTLTVYSSAHRVIIDWQSFSIAAGDTVTFVEPDKNAIVVNRQLGGGESDIYGVITSLVNGSIGGNVWIINPNGVLFGSGAQINVGGFLASTSNLTSDTTFLTEGDDAPITFAAEPTTFAAVGNTTGGITLDAGSNITVHDGTAAFIGSSIVDYGAVTGAGSFQTDTKAVFATAQNFTLRFNSNPPDPLRATDLDLVDLSATTGGGDITLGAGSTTTAGQVIVDNFAFLSGLSPNNYGSTNIAGAVIDATGDRGDGFDLMILSGNVTGGAPIGGLASDQTIVNIGPDSGSTPSTTLTSAGGLYIGGDYVRVNVTAGAEAAFDVAGSTTIVGHKGVNLNNIADPGNVYGGYVHIWEDEAALVVGNITASSNVIVHEYQGATIDNVTAGGFVNLFTGEVDLSVGNIHAGSLYVNAFGNVTLGNIVSTGGRGVSVFDGGAELKIGNITAAYTVGVYHAKYAAGNVTIGAIDAGQNVYVTDLVGRVATGDVTAGGLVRIGAAGVSSGNITASTAYITSTQSILTGDITTSSAGPDGGSSIEITAHYGSVTTGNLSGVSIAIDGAQYIETGDLTTTGGIGIVALNMADVHLGNVSAGGSLFISSGHTYLEEPYVGTGAVTVGNIEAAGGVNIGSEGSVTTNAIDASAVSIQAGTGTGSSIDVNGDITAAGVVRLQAGGAITTGAIDPSNVYITSTYGSVTTGAITSAGGVTVNAYDNIATGAVTAGGGVYMDAAHGGVTTGNIDAGSATINANAYVGLGNVTTTGATYVANHGAGEIVVGDIHAGSVRIEDGLPDALNYPNSTVTIGNVSSAGSVFISSGGDISTAYVDAGGSVRLVSARGSISAGPITTPSYAYILAFGPSITLGGLTALDAFVQAGKSPFATAPSGLPPSDLTITGPVNVQGGVFTASGTFHDLAPITVTASAGGALPLGFARGRIEIAANDVDIEAPIAVIDAGGTGTISLISTNPAGLDLGDNLSNPAGFEVSGAEFSRLEADNVHFVELSQTAGVRIGDLTIDASKTPSVGIYAGDALTARYGVAPSQTISIEGTVEGIGNPTFVVGGGSYTPAHIVVSGSLGTADDPLGVVSLNAGSSIVIGSQAFANEVANGTATYAWSEGLGGVEDGHSFVTAGDVVLASGGVIVGQDTSPIGGGMTVIGSLTIEGGPMAVNLFGALAGVQGELFGAAAASSPELFVIGATNGPYRFNGCLFGSAACEPTVNTPVTSFAPPLYAPTAGVYSGASPVTIVINNGADFGPAPTQSAFGPIVVAPSALPLGGDRDDGDDSANGDSGANKDDQHSNRLKKKGQKSTVSGMGNEDHWPEGKQ